MVDCPVREFSTAELTLQNWNVATHTSDEWTEQVGLEHLAVLSVVAWWTDEAELVIGT